MLRSRDMIDNLSELDQADKLDLLLLRLVKFTRMYLFCFLAQKMCLIDCYFGQLFGMITL